MSHVRKGGYVLTLHAKQRARERLGGLDPESWTKIATAVKSRSHLVQRWGHGTEVHHVRGSLDGEQVVLRVVCGWVRHGDQTVPKFFSVMVARPDQIASA